MKKLKIAIIGYIASLYAVQAALVFNEFWGMGPVYNSFDELEYQAYSHWSHLSERCLLISGILAVAMWLFALICLLLEFKNIAGDPQKQFEFNRLTLIIKLALIPFFILNFALWAFLSLAIIMFIVVVVAIAMGITYCLILPGSIYAITGLYMQYKNKRLSAEQLVLHGFLQLLPVLDVVGYIVVYREIKKKAEIIQVN